VNERHAALMSPSLRSLVVPLLWVQSLAKTVNNGVEIKLEYSPFFRIGVYNRPYLFHAQLIFYNA
jgi:hypothetical protein